MIKGKAAYELKGKFLDDLRNNAFSKTNGEDTVEHIENFLKIINPLDLPNVSYEQLRLAIFLISLTGDVREWLMNETQCSVTSWVDLTELFFGKYNSPSHTGDKTYEEYKNERSYKLNNDPREPWSENGVPYELIDHICEPFHFKNGKTKCPNCSFNEDGFCNGGGLPGMMNDHECSPFTNWRNHIHKTYVNTNIDANYNPYLDVSRTFNNHARWHDDETIREERKPNNGHGIENLDNELVRDSAHYHSSDEEGLYEEDRCEMLGNPS
nr:hypothetical protein [Tanacetum cinerariifolium]